MMFMRKILTKEQELTLREMHRLERDSRVADRIKAVLLRNEGWQYNKIAKALMLDKKTIGVHIREYIEKSKLKPLNGGSESKLDEDQTSELVSHLETSTYLKVSDICEHVKGMYEVSYTVSGMTSWLRSNGFSYKKPAVTPHKSDPVKQESFIESYEKLKREVSHDEPILFGDGVHPTMATKVSHGWIRTGKRKPIATTASRTRMNIMGSLDLSEMSLHATSHKTLDSAAMDDHFKHLRSLYPKAPNIHLILDRGPYNISSLTKESAEKYGIKLHYLPPYSPNLNPIERCWKVMNEQVRNCRFFHSATEFKEKITEFFNVRWPEMASSLVDRINDNFQRLKSTSSF